jgi:hypothetical protein
MNRDYASRRVGIRAAEQPWPTNAAALLPGHTEAVKTAISVPDETFEQATKRAGELGISRSEWPRQH